MSESQKRLFESFCKNFLGKKYGPDAKFTEPHKLNELLGKFRKLMGLGHGYDELEKFLYDDLEKLEVTEKTLDKGEEKESIEIKPSEGEYKIEPEKKAKDSELINTLDLLRKAVEAFLDGKNVKIKGKIVNGDDLIKLAENIKEKATGRNKNVLLSIADELIKKIENK